MRFMRDSSKISELNRRMAIPIASSVNLADVRRVVQMSNIKKYNKIKYLRFLAKMCCKTVLVQRVPGVADDTARV
jgi:hypothetical protein